MKIDHLKAFFVVLSALFLSLGVTAQDHGHDQTQEAHDPHASEHATSGCGEMHHEMTEYNPGAVAFHHIADQHIYTIGPVQLPLPCILYAKDHGWSVFSSGKFHIHGHHGDGTRAVEGYVLTQGKVHRVNLAEHPDFPSGEVEIAGVKAVQEIVNGKAREVSYVCYQDQLYPLEAGTTADFGLFGGGPTSFMNFSITKNVVVILIAVFLLSWMFLSIAKSYRVREGMAPKGIQSFIEPLYIFIRDEVAKGMIGPRYERYMPFLMSLFFFILVLNLAGQIPFIGSPNVTGNLAVTLVLAIITFFVVNLSGNGHYWKHILWMPGIPIPVKILMTPIEILGLFLKPITLMVRLFANITAGHIVVLSFVGLIFIFGKMGESIGGGYGGAVVSILLTLFMSAIELLVAFIQAFIFTILTASYIGAAVADDHH